MTTRRALVQLISPFVLCSLAMASVPLPPGLYDVTVETSMPHLEESLRYATTHEQRCLQGQELTTAFPVLHHASLKNCRLEREERTGDTVSHLLVCANGSGTTGSAHWTLGQHRADGTLHVKLGGKNMTFLQRWTAVRRGNCSTSS
jgi:hypothetical protein